MGNFVVWFVKATGVLPFLAWYRPKKYYEDPADKRCGKGEILTANHTTLMDFAMMLFTCPFRVVRVLMAEVLYSNPFMKWFLKNLKGIRVDRTAPENTDRLREAIETLNAGGLVGVFPEGRLNPEGKGFGNLLPFSPGAAYLALRTGAPVRPLYFHVDCGLRRSHIMVGRAVDLRAMFGSDTGRENVEKATRFLRQKTEQLREQAKFRSEFREDSLITRFTQWSVRVGMKIAFPFTLHLEEGAEDPKAARRRCIVASNHISVFDPPLLCMVFPRSKLHILACEALYEYPMLGVLLNRLGCIRIDRTLLDIESFHLMQAMLDKGESIGVFPEGSLSPDGTLRPFKPGTILAAAAGGVEIVPVYIAGQGRPFRRKGRDVWVGKAVALPQSLAPEAVQEGTELLRRRIEELRDRANGGRVR